MTAVQRGLLALGVTVLVLGFVGGLWWHRSGAPMRTETVRCLALEAQIGCDLSDGWTVAVPIDVAWTDNRGTYHESGRPACLPATGVGLGDPVRVTWTPVEAGGARWRQVVWVGC